MRRVQRGCYYRYTGYLVFDYFITDSNGDATLQFETGSCYHVLWKTSQRSNTADDGPVKGVMFDPARAKPTTQTIRETRYPSLASGSYYPWGT